MTPGFSTWSSRWNSIELVEKSKTTFWRCGLKPASSVPVTSGHGFAAFITDWESSKSHHAS